MAKCGVRVVGSGGAGPMLWPAKSKALALKRTLLIVSSSAWVRHVHSSDHCPHPLAGRCARTRNTKWLLAPRFFFLQASRVSELEVVVHSFAPDTCFAADVTQRVALSIRSQDTPPQLTCARARADGRGELRGE